MQDWTCSAFRPSQLIDVRSSIGEKVSDEDSTVHLFASLGLRLEPRLSRHVGGLPYTEGSPMALGTLISFGNRCSDGGEVWNTCLSRPRQNINVRKTASIL